MKPLEGIKIIELANYVAASIVGRIAADMGASVIKIEGRGGDAWRFIAMNQIEAGPDEIPLFDTFNAGKESLSLNLKTDAGRKVFFRLLEGADVLVTNTRQKSLRKMGLDYDSLKELFPRLIYASMTGYGEEGAMKDAPGFDNISFWARTGFSMDVSTEGVAEYPANMRYGVGDSVAGSLLFGSVMTALFQRERTGKGDYVTMSLYGAGIWATAGCIVMAQAPYNHKFPEKRTGVNPMTNPYRCRDGEWIKCVVFEYERFAKIFFETLGIWNQVQALEVADYHSMVRKAEEIVPMCEQAFAQKSADEWVQEFSALDIVCGRLNHFADVLHDPQAWDNQYLSRYRCPNGAERVIVSSPVRMRSQGVFRPGEPPVYGGNNRSVLASLGCSEEEIEAMEEDGTLGNPHSS